MSVAMLDSDARKMKLQFFELSLTQGEKTFFDIASILPGPERLWDLFIKSHGPLHCKKREFYAFDFGPTENLSLWQKILIKFNEHPLLRALPVSKVEGVHMLRIPKALAPHSTESLILDILELTKIPTPLKIRNFSCYEFYSGADQPETRAEVLDTLEKIFFSELKEYLYDQELFNFLTRAPDAELKDAFSQTRSSTENAILSPEEMIQGISSLPNSWLRSTVKIKSQAPREGEMEILLDPLEKTLPPFGHSKAETTLKPSAAFLPRKNIFASGENQSFFSCADTLPLSKNSLLPGYVQDFDAPLLIPSLPGRLLSHGPIGATKRLFFLGPFHRHNYEIQSSILNFLQRLQEIDADSIFETGYSFESWGQKFLSLAAQSSGWECERLAFQKLWELDKTKNRLDYSLFILSTSNPEVFIPDGLKNKIDFLQLGSSATSNLMEFVTEHNRESLDWESLKLLFQLSPDKISNLNWSYNEKMSPIYGYDSAALFPAQMTLKVNYRNKSEIQWAQSFTKRPPHPQSLRSYFRNSDENPRTYEKFFDQTLKKKILSLALTGPEMSENPFQAGINMVDFSVRQLLCYTRHLCKNAEARISVLCPRLKEKKYWSALHLAIDGTLNGLKLYNMKLMDFDVSAYSSSSRYPELRLMVEYPALDLALPFDGLRMTEEVLFALGPKPPFVEVGSKILRHVRVFSNYVTQLDMVKQEEIYTKIVDLFSQGKILTAFPLSQGGIIEGLVELGIKGQAGVQVRPGIHPIELFSSSPGRILIGVAPQEAREIEKMFPAEFLSKIGNVNGSKIYGASLDELAKTRQGRL